MNKEKSELLYLFVGYTFIIVVAIWWSGYVTSPSVYDRYLTKVEGISVEVRDIPRAVEFFKKVLNFQSYHEQDSIMLFPDRRKLFLKQVQEPNPIEIVLRVRNGLPKLYSEIKSRILERNKENPQVMISDYRNTNTGDEFVLCDHDGNRFVFFRPKRRSLTRDDEP